MSNMYRKFVESNGRINRYWQFIRWINSLRDRPNILFEFDPDSSLLSCTIDINSHSAKVIQVRGESEEDFYARCRLTIRLMMNSLVGSNTT